jgi:hypothetical protein
LDAEWDEHVETITMMARKMGLETGDEVLYEPHAEINISKDGERIGHIDWVPKHDGTQWVARGDGWCGRNHGDLKDAMEELVANHKKHGKKVRIKAHRQEVFEIVLEFDKDLKPLWNEKGKPTERQELNQKTESFLADVLYAYRHQLVPKGMKLKKIRVGDAERTV